MNKRFALYPDERDKICRHWHTPWNGQIPCTGSRQCTMCGTIVPDNYIPPKVMTANVHHNGKHTRLGMSGAPTAAQP
jgi:hypothetical protein